MRDPRLRQRHRCHGIDDRLLLDQLAVFIDQPRRVFEMALLVQAAGQVRGNHGAGRHRARCALLGAAQASSQAAHRIVDASLRGQRHAGDRVLIGLTERMLVAVMQRPRALHQPPRFIKVATAVFVDRTRIERHAVLPAAAVEQMLGGIATGCIEIFDTVLCRQYEQMRHLVRGQQRAVGAVVLQPRAVLRQQPVGLVERAPEAVGDDRGVHQIVVRQHRIGGEAVGIALDQAEPLLGQQFVDEFSEPRRSAHRVAGFEPVMDHFFAIVMRCIPLRDRAMAIA